jgi:hypothetical protein
MIVKGQRACISSPDSYPTGVPFSEEARSLMTLKDGRCRGLKSLDRIDRRLGSNDVRPAVCNIAGTRRSCVLRDDQPAERAPKGRSVARRLFGNLVSERRQSVTSYWVEPVVNECARLIIRLQFNRTFDSSRHRNNF